MILYACASGSIIVALNSALAISTLVCNTNIYRLISIHFCFKHKCLIELLCMLVLVVCCDGVCQVCRREHGFLNATHRLCMLVSRESNMVRSSCQYYVTEWLSYLFPQIPCSIFPSTSCSTPNMDLLHCYACLQWRDIVWKLCIPNI